MASPTSLRIAPDVKRRIEAAARKRGVSTKEFMVAAALKEAEGIHWADFFAAHPPAALPKDAPRDPLPAEATSEVTADWNRVALERLAAVESGRLTLRPGEEVMARMRQIVGR